MPAGQTPHTTIVYAHNDLVDKVQPGDRVNITGITQHVYELAFLFWVKFVSIKTVEPIQIFFNYFLTKGC